MPRLVEAGLAAGGLLLCGPLLGTIALAVWLNSGGPVLFPQRRVGRGGEEFTLFKFRTMRSNVDLPGATASRDPRVTLVGRWLRLLKLDELPELWNVVRGDMSLVGPRPEIPGYVDMSNPLWRAVLCARPGLTHPVTLLLRNEEVLLAGVPDNPERFYREVLLPYKLAGYLEYQERRSIASDWGILVRTLGAVIVPALAPPPSLDSIRAAIAKASAAEPDQASCSHDA